MMNFRIADTFTDSLARLTGDEQKAVKTTAFDLQLNPANPGAEAGMSFRKLDKAMHLAKGLEFRANDGSVLLIVVEMFKV